MSEPTITYLGPAGGSDMGDGTMSKHCNEAVEGDDGGLVTCRGCKARGTYTELPTGECPTPYKPDRVLLAESIAREQALQLRLNAADQRIDELEGLLRDARIAAGKSVKFPERKSAVDTFSTYGLGKCAGWNECLEALGGAFGEE